MSGRLEGRTALVTAAAAGIGRASALAMAREGARVWATDIDDSGLASLARGTYVVKHAHLLLPVGEAE